MQKQIRKSKRRKLKIFGLLALVLTVASVTLFVAEATNENGSVIADRYGQLILQKNKGPAGFGEGIGGL
ncbi:hypothetical protein [Rhizobium sp. MHM7A]|uniref:hypothetical protein n=1 Tax=Rhizobium sp. MHM7A TaxID=2583233 RepID=UPI0011060F02|nr:hypothetical protein [Rhizobium sp. MHM7A]TLX16438.1 hypothetical protein FFR93_03635 [Rhizobium sp. MHM7A]